MEFPSYVTDVLDRLWQCGYEAYVVGGSLRDLLLGKTPYDYDVTTSATPEQMTAAFSDYRTIPTGLRHGTLTVLSQGNPIEVTTYRIDGDYRDSRHPECVTFTKNIREDLARRDFTVNAIAYHPQTGLVDPFDGMADLKQKILRAVGEPQKRFEEDALRIMRAFRFSAQLAFDVEPQTFFAISQAKEGLSHIARERIGSELLRLLAAPAPQSVLCRMAEAGVTPYVFGEKVSVCMEELDATPQDSSLRLGCLLRHNDEATRRAVYAALRCSNEQAHRAELAVTALSEHWQGDAVHARRILCRCGKDALLLADLALALRHTDIHFANTVKEQHLLGVPTQISDLAITGKDLMALGFCGREIGQTLSRLLSAVIEDPTKNNKEDLLACAKAENIQRKNRS